MKSLYFAVLLYQTALALAALGLAGGGLMACLQRPGRRWLWLASPLAGLMALAALLPVTHHGLRLSIPVATVVTWALLCVPTLWVLWRSPSPGRFRVAWLGVAAVLAVTAWSVYACNRPSLRAGEPAVVPTDGSDQYGYAAHTDWLLAAPGEMPPCDIERPHLAYPNMLWQTETRHSAFLLLGSAAWLRKTSAIFSYDWLNGVILAAGILGLGGLFATRRMGLVLLLTAGVLSAWFAVARTGYLGRAIGFPGTILLAYSLWACWESFSLRRLALVGVIGAGISLGFHPGVTQVVGGLLFVGGLGGAILFNRSLSSAPAAVGEMRLLDRVALAGTIVAAVGVVGLTFAGKGTVNLIGFGLAVPLLLFIARWRRRPAAFRGVSWDCVGIGLLAYLVACGPVTLHTRFTHPTANAYLCTVVPWDWALPLALDLESANLRILPPAGVGYLLLACVIVSALLLLSAWRTRNVEAFALMLLSVLVVAGCYFGPNRIYVFAGLLFPLSACGAVAVWQRLERSSPLAVRDLVLLLVIGFVALRLPQHLGQWDRYVHHHKHHYQLYTKSEMKRLARAIGDKQVDVVTTCTTSSFLMMVELGRAGCKVRMRSPTWQQMLTWCNAWKMPVDVPPADYVLCDAPGPLAVREPLVQTPHYTLTSGRDAVSVLGFAVPHGVGHDARGSAMWVGHQPAVVEVYNDGPEAREVVLTADCNPGPAVADRQRRTVHITAAGKSQSGTVWDGNRWHLSLPLTLPPGRSRIELTAADRADTDLAGEKRDLVVLMRSLRLHVTPRSTTPGTDARGAQLEGGAE